MTKNERITTENSRAEQINFYNIKKANIQMNTTPPHIHNHGHSLPMGKAAVVAQFLLLLHPLLHDLKKQGRPLRFSNQK